ncbi:MAG: alanine:cation symporter family protein [Bacteroidales bacterium]|nr:alanine:cation symporter family protein [Bacteroidales bacterium]
MMLSSTIGEVLTSIVEHVNSWVWSPPLVVLCLLAGVYFSVAYRFVQVRKLPEMVRLLFANDKKQKTGISSFQAFAMALSGRVGTGNIVGVATALAFGGPGAIVWMWIIAFFGAGSAFTEATLAQIYKENHHGEFRGGPAYYMEKGLRSTWLGCIFAVICAVSCGIFLPPVQCNGIAMSFARTFDVGPWIVGLVVAVLIAVVIIGGVKRIANVAQIVAPFMAILYIVLSLVVLAINYKLVPGVLWEMLQGAVGINQVGAAIFGSTIAWGVKRGIYSNEAGQGTAPIVAAAAKVSHPVKQGLVQAFSVYIDTLLVCTATAVMILACKTYNIIGSVKQVPGGDPVIDYLLINPNAPLGEPGVYYTSNAIGTLVGLHWGDIIISTALFFFAFTTIMAYYYYAETNLVYLFSRWRGRKLRKAQRNMRMENIINRQFGATDELQRNSDRETALKAQMERADLHFGDDRGEKVVVYILRLLTITAVFLGSTVGSGMVWTLGDIGVGSTAWMNIITILLLSPQAIRALYDYERQQSSGKEPVFDPKRLKIKGADFWEEKVES